MAEKGDMSERKQSRELDSLRRDTAAIARLLRQANLDELHQELEQAKTQLDYAESRLSGDSTESE
tara:strand:- start:316 stop:510 length:195 start_codon:yes stop_codon:yes gene_type:complete